MCYILCIAVPQDLAGAEDRFEDGVELGGLSEAPIASAVIGAAKKRRAYAVTVGGCSCDLLVGGHRMDGRPELLTAGIAGLLTDVPEVSLLKHWFTRPVGEVAVHCDEEKKMSLAKFKKLYPRLDDDVRYVVTPR